MHNTNYQTLYEEIDYIFKDTTYLKYALTRTAFARENGIPLTETMDYLAVLGDAVLDVVVISSIIDTGECDKGEITRLKMNMVNMSVFRHFAESISLSSYVRWGAGEERMRIWESGRVAAECFESLCGAAYLDGGISAVKQIFEKVSKQKTE